MKTNRVQVECIVCALIVSSATNKTTAYHWGTAHIKMLVDIAVSVADEINARDLPGSPTEEMMGMTTGLMEKAQENLKPVLLPEFCKICGYMDGHHQKECPNTDIEQLSS